MEDSDCKFPDDDGFVRPDGKVEYTCECFLSSGCRSSPQFGLEVFCLLVCTLVCAILNDLPCDVDQGWKFRYSVACLTPTVNFCSSLKKKKPGYSQLLQLDRKIRTFPLPKHLQSPLDESPEGWADNPPLAMQQYGAVCERESSEQFGDIRQFGGSADRSC